MRFLISSQLPRARYDPVIECFLEEIYAECNRGERLNLDPLNIAKRYRAEADIEVAGFVCAMLAFGSVELILRACEQALQPLGAHPAQALREMNRGEIEHAWENFQYRFFFPQDMKGSMWAVHKALCECGSLEALFVHEDAHSSDQVDETVLQAASGFVQQMRRWSREIVPEGIRKNLLPDPADGSAAKRLFLFLRWMIRHDEIDPGCWDAISPSRLIIPLDTHMVRTCTERLRFLPTRGSTARATATLRDALRVTEAFRIYAPEDPVKYDFALTRPGIDPWDGDERFGCL